METIGILSLVPPVIGVGLALWKKQIIAALFLAILVGEVLLAKGDVFTGFMGTLDNALRVTSTRGNLEIIFFSVLVGALLALIREANGFRGFVEWFEKRRNFKGRPAVFGLTYLLNVSIFIETYSNVLVTGSTMRPLYDKMKISRERLGYFIHTIGINTVALVIFNSWGAFYMSLLATQGVSNPFKLVLKAMPMNFYCLASLFLAAIVMLTGLTIGPMKKAEIRARQGYSGEGGDKSSLPEDMISSEGGPKPSAFNMIMPIVVLLASIIGLLLITGKGDITQGSGATAVFNGAAFAVLITGGFFLVRKIFNFQKLMDVVFKGMSELLPVGVLLVLALTLGDLCKRMGTGGYLAGLIRDGFPAFLLPALIFGIGCVISFATGTSYGTFAIMVPIALPMAAALDIPAPLAFAACISGGVFGDNCSPISDTSIVTGMAAKIGVVDHARTQLPYALIAASFALLAFVAAGVLL